jgi:histidine triad (HIT) family protein
MENCIFCKIVRGEITSVKIWEDDKYLAFLDISPLHPGHTLVLPKKHTDYVFDLKDDEYQELMLKVKELAIKLKSKLKAEKIGMLVEGLAVPHVHVHLIPLNRGDLLNPNLARSATTEELNKIAEKING